MASPGTLAVRATVARVLTTVGSEHSADLRLATVAARWAVIQRDDEGVSLRHLASGRAHRLTPGESVTLDGVTVGLERGAGASEEDGLDVARVADALSGVESPLEALRTLLREAMRAAQADTGAIVLAEGGSHTVAVAEDAAGRAVAGASALLSDTIVRDALDGGHELTVEDAATHARYKHVPSVVSMKLRSVACVPMRAGSRVIGLVFLGRHDVRRPLSARKLAELEVVAQMAVPLLAQLRRRLAAPAPRDAEELLAGESAAIREVRRLVARVAPTDVSVLVLGETGTGKELVARALHGASPRRERPLVAVNCAAVPEGLLAAELFGAKKGAFTGAVADRKGVLEQAHEGTLFLDELGDMPLSMQAALLRALETREITRLGDDRARPASFRLVAATHADLDAEVRAGRFREDLLFRIREVPIALPPLRARGDDVLLLAGLFLRRAEAELGLATHALADDAKELLARHRWPGNVRELRAAMRRAALLARDLDIRSSDLGLGDSAHASSDAALGDLARPLEDARDDFARRYVAAVLDRHAGNREAAAAALGISLRSLYRLL